MFIFKFEFFIFLLLLLLIFYFFPKFQKLILIISCLFFYCSISDLSIFYSLAIIFSITVITYFGALLSCNNIYKNFALIITILLLFLLLIKFKYYANLIESFNLLFNCNFSINSETLQIVGISYYTLSAIGYIIEVYWGNIIPSRNFFDVLLFIFYFPIIISGPVIRYKDFQFEINKQHTFNCENFINSLLRMLWGYTKKLVIANRFSEFVQNPIYSNTDYNFNGIIYFFATLCYAVELYCDFSGCMDILLGVSQMLSINLPENFNRPFSSKTVQEFWQRWHITLGQWFKDFVMYPLQKSHITIFIGDFTRNIFGKKIGKRISLYFSMIILWFLIGLWHGGTICYFVASGFIPFIIIFLEDIFSMIFKLKINFNYCNYFIKLLFRLKTLFCIMICWIFVCSNSITKGINVIKSILFNFIDNNTFDVIINLFEKYNIGAAKLVFICLVFILYFIDDYIYENYNIDIKYKIFNSHILIKVLLIYCLFFSISILSGGVNQFIYFQF